MTAQPLLVIKVGGALLRSGATLEGTAASIAATQRAGYRVVVVHGGGSAISTLARALGLVERKVNGLRVTDAATAEVALAVLAGTQGKSLAAALGRQGCEAVSLCGADAQLLTARVVAGGELGFVGRIEKVRTGLLVDLLDQGRIPLVAPLAPLAPEYDGPGTPLHNINADGAAGPIAQALQADALLFLTDVEGVLDGTGQCLAHLDRKGAQQLRASGILGAGMLPKIHSALLAAEALPRAQVRISGVGPRGQSLHNLLADERGTRIGAREVPAHG